MPTDRLGPKFGEVLRCLVLGILERRRNAPQARVDLGDLRLEQLHRAAPAAEWECDGREARVDRFTELLHGNSRQSCSDFRERLYRETVSSGAGQRTSVHFPRDSLEKVRMANESEPEALCKDAEHGLLRAVARSDARSDRGI